MAERDHIIALRSAPIGYEQDYAAWLDRQMALLRDRRFEELDLDHLVDEVGDLGLSAFKGFVSAVEVVLLHMLKWDHQPEHRGRSWSGSIAEHRIRVEDALQESPSYKARRDDAVIKAYRTARVRASQETDLPLATFPEACPYDWQAITARDHPLED